MLEVLFLNCGMEFSQRKNLRAYNPNIIPLGINRCCASFASPPEVDSHVDELEAAGASYQLLILVSTLSCVSSSCASAISFYFATKPVVLKQANYQTTCQYLGLFL
jgi:hypothetical protein